MKTVSLGLAKTLKEKGYPQKDSFAYWVKDAQGTEWHSLYNPKFIPALFDEFICAAPTADELLDQLPENITLGKYQSGATQDLEYYSWIDGGELAKKIKTLPEFEEHTAADAIAKMWLYLKENDLLES